VLITRHALGKTENGRRLPFGDDGVASRNRRLELDLSGRDKAQAGAVLPPLYSLSGEEIAILEPLEPVVWSIVKGADPSRCSHCHYVHAPPRTALRQLIPQTTRSGLWLRQMNTQAAVKRKQGIIWRSNGAWRGALARRRKSMQENLKNYALGFCLFVFLFVIIGGGFHLTSGVALIGALSGTPLVIYGFNRWCDARCRKEEAHTEAPVSEIIPVRERS
jgi:hypothetical protein